MGLTGYLAPENFEKDLLAEIGQHQELKLIKNLERLFIVEGPEKPLAFSQWTWQDLQRADVESIGQSAKTLKNAGKLWSPYSTTAHRRVALIQEQLPKIKNDLQLFGEPAPQRILGAWTLENEKTLWFSSKTNSAYPLGEVHFVETKEAPSRAYLKLWEYFTITGQFPKRGETCIDLGSSPGGWTWVLSNLGCEVISVDKAPLAPNLQNRKNIRSLKKDAFTLKPEDVGPIDWLFSDLICYPERLLQLVNQWMDSGLVKNFVCTIKFKGETDFKSLKAFQEIPGSEIRHLSCNKHEVTWSLIKDPTL